MAVTRRAKSKLKFPGWFIRYCFVSGFDGLRFVVSVHNIIGRTMWILLTTLAAVAVGYYSWQVVDNYNQKTVATSLSIVERSNLTLPKLFVFPHSRFNNAKRIQMGMSEQLAQYVQISFALSSTFSALMYKATLAFTQNMTHLMLMEKELAILMATKNITLDQILSDICNTCEDVVDYCAVSGFKYNCCAYAGHYLTSFGVGIMIPTPPQVGDGTEAGVKIGLKLPAENRTAAPNGQWVDGFSLKLFEANSDVEAGTIHISLGKHTQLQAKAIKYDLINDARSPCHENPDGFYRRVICAYSCDFKPAMLSCGCSPAGLATLRLYLANLAGMSGKVCTPAEIFQCFLPAAKNPNISNPAEAAKCLKQCPPMCRRVEYEKSVVSIDLSPNMARGFMGNETVDKWNAEYAILSVFFSNTELTTMKQFYATSFIEAFGVFAGQFGLWLGSSVMGVVHIVIWIVFEVNKKCTRS